MRVFPISENSSSKIFSLKYDEIPSVKKSPNFRNVVNKVKTTPTNVIPFLIFIDIGTVIVANKSTNAVINKTKVGAITTKLKFKISETELI